MEIGEGPVALDSAIFIYFPVLITNDGRIGDLPTLRVLQVEDYLEA